MSNEFEGFVDRARWAWRTVFKRRWLVLGVSAGVALASGVVVTAVPNRYEASARVYVDTQTVLKPLMAGLTFQPDVDQQVRLLARTLISRPNVERLVRMPELELDVADVGAREVIVSRLLDKIKVTPTSTGNLYAISYRGSSPESAKRIVKATADMFVRAGAGGKKRDSQDAGQFVADEIRIYEAKLTEAENRLKDFKMRNFGVSGVSNQDYFARVSALTDEVGKLRIELSAAEQSRDSYRRELAVEDPQLPAELDPKAGGGAAFEADSRLDAQRKQLDELLRRYTDEHPDVVAARRVIGELEVAARERKSVDARSTAKGGKAATSPVYQKLRVSLAESEAQVASLRSQLSMQQGRLEQVRAVAGKVPQVEAELTQLNRDYDIIRKNYDQMVARREAASLGERVDESSQLAEFRVIDPPEAAPSPVFPSRLHLALMAIVASLLAGAIAAVVADFAWPTFDEMASLRTLSGRPVLGSVSMLVTPERQREQKLNLVRFSAALAALVMLQAMWVAWVALKPNLA